VRFTRPVLLTDVPSLSDDGFIGHYFGTAATMRRFHVAWTDRADKTRITDPEDDVFCGSAVALSPPPPKAFAIWREGSP
jgi:hypothetical protein